MNLQMKNVLKVGRKSISKTYITLFSLFVLFILIVGTVLTVYSYTSFDRMQEEREELVHKQQVIKETSDSFNEILFRARGYYAFLDANELAILENELDEFPMQINAFEEVASPGEEMQMVSDLRAFFEVYVNELWPTARDYVESGDLDALRELSAGGTNETVNEFLSFSRTFASEADRELSQMNESIIQHTRQVQIIWYIAVGIAILLFGIIGARGLRAVAIPISQLNLQIESYSFGDSISSPHTKRDDEIGSLARSFEQMSKHIQKSEYELIAQNEQMKAQQEALEEYLSITEEAKEKLSWMNHFNEMLALNNSRQDHLRAAFKFINQQFSFDKAALKLHDTPYLHATGLNADQLTDLDDRMANRLLRLKDEDYLVMKREGITDELGIRGGSVNVHELTVPVLNIYKEQIGYFTGMTFDKEITEATVADLRRILGRLEGALEVAHANEQIKESKEINQAIIENINEGIQLVGNDGTLLAFNKYSCELVGCKLKESSDHEKIYRKFHWVHPFSTQLEEPESFASFIIQATSDMNDEIKQLQTTAMIDGTRRDIAIYSTSVRVGEENIGTVFVYRDITREAEVDRLKTELVSTVNHELRTPLSSIMGFTERMLNKDISEERRRVYLETILSESERLSQLVNNFLDLQKIESIPETMELEAVKISDCLQQALSAFHPSDSHRLEVADRAGDVWVRGNAESLHQVFLNLLGNAEKYSPEGGTITVETELDESKKNVLVHISDEGIGIAKKDHDRLFMKFSRITEQHGGTIKGTGLGLALSKELMEAQGGDVRVRSEVGEGSTFTVVMQVKEASE